MRPRLDWISPHSSDFSILKKLEHRPVPHTWPHLNPQSLFSKVPGSQFGTLWCSIEQVGLLLRPFPCSSSLASLVLLISIHLSTFQLPELCGCHLLLSASLLCLQRKKSRCHDTTESVSVEGSESVHHL